MTDPGPLAEQIAASVEDVQELLQGNKSLSIALLSRMLRDHQEETRRYFREYRRVEAKIAEQGESIDKLEKRLEVAGTKFNDLRDELDQLKQKEKPSEH